MENESVFTQVVDCVAFVKNIVETISESKDGWSVKDVLTFVIPVIVSLFALVVSAFSWKQAKKSADETEKQRLTNQGLQEMEIWKNFSNIKREMLDCHRQFFLSENLDEMKTLMKYQQQLSESLRNFYEILCSNYLNEKLDNGSFLNLYEKSLLSFVESDANAEFYKENSVYENTLKVYEKFKIPSPK